MKDVKYKAVIYPDISEADLEEARKLDELVYDLDFQISQDIGKEWYNKNPEISILIKDIRTDKLIGYTALIPVVPECYDLFKSGQLKDPDLKADSILSYSSPGFYDLYFCSIVIHPDYRKDTHVIRTLLSSIFSKFLGLYEERGIVIRRMVADTVSEEGSKLAELFGMVLQGESNHGSKVYEVSMYPPRFNQITEGAKILFMYYDSCHSL